MAKDAPPRKSKVHFLNLSKPILLSESTFQAWRFMKSIFKNLYQMKLMTMRQPIAVIVTNIAIAATLAAAPESNAIKFNSEKDVISLHYDHAPDRDDGHSAAADRTLLESVFGKEWMAKNVVAVSGAYGNNKHLFDHKSDAVMDAVWNERGGWIAADRDWDSAVNSIYKRWQATLTKGGDVYVKEGGQSDVTAAVVERLKQEHPEILTRQRIHVVQHSDWNEKHTTPNALEYVKTHTHYIRIADANRYLNVKGGDAAFVKSATAHPLFGHGWRAAFDYYAPETILDFSDTGELLHILGLGEIGIEEFRKRFMSAPAMKTFTTPQADVVK